MAHVATVVSVVLLSHSSWLALGVRVEATDGQRGKKIMDSKPEAYIHSSVTCCVSDPKDGVISFKMKEVCSQPRSGTHRYKLDQACCANHAPSAERCRLTYICTHQPQLVEQSCSLRKSCEALRAGGNASESRTACRQKTVFIVRHGESEANLEIERNGVVGWTKVLQPGARARLRDPPLTLKGKFGDRLENLARIVRENHITADAYLSSPLTRAVETAVIGFQDELLIKPTDAEEDEDEGIKKNVALEMLPILREKKKLLVEFGDKGRMYGPASEGCENTGLSQHIQTELLELAGEASDDTPTKKMLDELSTKLSFLRLELSASEEIKAALLAAGADEAVQWYNACQNWWEGPKADSERATSKRRDHVATVLGLRPEHTLALIGHSSFWRGYFKDFIHMDQFATMTYEEDAARDEKRDLALKLTQRKLQNAAIVKVTLDCEGETGPCSYISDVESLETKFD